MSQHSSQFLRLEESADETVASLGASESPLVAESVRACSFLVELEQLT